MVFISLLRKTVALRNVLLRSSAARAWKCLPGGFARLCYDEFGQEHCVMLALGFDHLLYSGLDAKTVLA